MAIVVGEAEVVITANTAGLDAEIAAASDPAFAKLGDDATAAGAEAGAGLRTGISDEAGKVTNDLGDVGLGAGTALSSGLAAGTKDIGSDTEAALAGSTGRMGTVLDDFKSKATSSLEGLGVPSGLISGLDGPLGLGVAAAGAAAAFVDMGMKMQNADASIATSAGISIKAATDIGNAFLQTGGQSEFSGQEMAEAFSSVAGQLKATEGQALTTQQALTVMNAATTLATASGTDLNTTTSTVATTLQAFGLQVKDSTQVTNALFVASNATGQGIDTVGQSLDKVKAKLGAVAPSIGDMSALLVDMTDHGETGRTAMTTLSTAFTTFLKPAADLATAQQNLNIAFKNLPESVQGIAEQYEKGTITSKQFEDATNGMSTTQAGLVSAFKSAATAAQTADKAQQALGITVTNSQGQMLPLTNIIAQLHTQIDGMTTSQAIAKLTADGFGTSASKLVAVIQAGPTAFEAAAKSTTDLNTVQDAANIKSQTLSVQFATLKSSLSDMGTTIGQALLPVVSVLMTVLTSLFNVVSQVLTPAINFIIPIFQNLVAVIQPVLAIITNLVDFVVDVFTGKWQAAWTAIQNVFSNFGTFIEKLIGDLLTLFINLPTKILSALANIGADLIGLFEKFPSWIENTMLPDIVSFFTGLPGDLVNAMGDVVGILAAPFEKAVNKIISLYNDIPLLPNIPLINISSSGGSSSSSSTSGGGISSNLSGMENATGTSSTATSSKSTVAAPSGYVASSGSGSSSSSGTSGSGSSVASSTPAGSGLVGPATGSVAAGRAALDADYTAEGKAAGASTASTGVPITQLTQVALENPQGVPQVTVTLNISSGAFTISQTPGAASQVDAATMNTLITNAMNDLANQLAAGVNPLGAVPT